MARRAAGEEVVDGRAELRLVARDGCDGSIFGSSQVADDPRVDAARIYVMGYSLGSGLASHLANELLVLSARAKTTISILIWRILIVLGISGSVVVFLLVLILIDHFVGFGRVHLLPLSTYQARFHCV